MKFTKSLLNVFCITVLAVCLLTPASVFAEKDLTEPVAEMSYGATAVSWMPKVQAHQFLLSVSAPDGSIFSKTFEGSATPVFVLSDLKDGLFLDGVYSYELKVIPTPNLTGRHEPVSSSTLAVPRKATVQTGSFNVMAGAIIRPTQLEELSSTRDVLHYDDVIITGSLCVGFDCINGESFGYCTTKLKENNLQLCFEDTSVGSFPTNDWKIQINDTTSGGASYFTIWDTDGGRRPFTIEAGAPSSAIYVEDYGRVGLGTSIPYVELHITDGDSPTIRLDQDGSSGWAAQKWDLCGNETNFFIRDVTNGSKLSFRIQPSTPSNTLCLKADGRVGVGTWSPTSQLEVEDTGTATTIEVDRTDGATTLVKSTATNGIIGTSSNHDLMFNADNDVRMTLTTAGRLSMAVGGGYYNQSNGDWINGSSREYKENIKDLSAKAAIDTIKKLKPVTFKMKVAEEGDNQVGFIAEDVPELVAQKDRKGLSAMDIVAVLTKVVQEQQEAIKRLEKKIETLEKK